MKKQALIITERILGTSHKDTIFRYSQPSGQTVGYWTGRRWKRGSHHHILEPHTRTPFSGIHSSQNRQLVHGQAEGGQQAPQRGSLAPHTRTPSSGIQSPQSRHLPWTGNRWSSRLSSSQIGPWHLTQGHHLQVFTFLKTESWFLDRQQMKKQTLSITERILT